MLTSSPLKVVIKISHDSNYTRAGSVLENIREEKLNHKEIQIPSSHSSAAISKLLVASDRIEAKIPCSFYPHCGT